MGWRSLDVEIGQVARQVARIAAIVTLSLGLADCGKVANKYGVAPSALVVAAGEPVPKGGGVYRVGKPYTIAGRTYTPEENPNYTATGLASWYGDDFHGRQTANGEVFDMNAISAAHPTLPMPSYVRVTNLNNRRSIIVRVNDRGPYHADRVIDVSVRAAKLLGFHDNGTTRVRVDYVGRAALEGSDDVKLAATLRHGDTPSAPVMVAARKPPVAPAAAPQGPQVLQAPAYGVASSQSRLLPAQPSRSAAVAPPASFETRFGPATTMPQAPVGAQPLSAYAPNAPAGVITGRGLY